MNGSLYWDDFNRRIKETVNAIKDNTYPPIRRVSVFITNKCNLKCKYCNMCFGNKEMPKDFFSKICNTHKNAIIHITGGEPSVVKWLYPFIEHNTVNRFHLNTNAILPPPKNIKRLKVSLDTFDKNLFQDLTGIDGFDRVVKHIKKATKYTLVSITFVLSKQTYKQSVEFMKYCRKTFPKLYAVFFSCYKGTDKNFVMTQQDVNEFWNNLRPNLEQEMDNESLWLFKHTSDEKYRLLTGKRFPENEKGICYLSMSERVYDYDGNVSNCSHLYRDGVCRLTFGKPHKCTYGCNRKLVTFNQEVEKLLLKEEN